MHVIESTKKQFRGTIRLNGSKSISNRLLILEALTQRKSFDLKGLSNAKDTQILNRLLNYIDEPLLDAEDAGTCYRFMTAYLAFKGEKKVLLGTKRMYERPIKDLVEALLELGADIHYACKEGYPPLSFGEHKGLKGGAIQLSAQLSSQYVSALLMIAPLLEGGLTLELVGEVVSRPYIEMTLKLMQAYGILYHYKDNYIHIPQQDYETPNDIRVEADWSAASYYYALVALAQSAQLELKGLYRESIQGDAVIVEIMKELGVDSVFTEEGILLKKGVESKAIFDYDFVDCPDLAQSCAVVAAALGKPAILRGLSTLRIKETDRIAALANELRALGAEVVEGDDFLEIKKGIDHTVKNPQIKTYKDHRMAMAFSALTMLYPRLVFDSKEVVNKSYPEFWKDLSTLGIEMAN